MKTLSNLITFVIPTRNRQYCLRSLLETFSRFYRDKTTRFDVVILDNSDDEFLANDLKNYSFEITYVYREDQLSVVDNFNQGVAYLKGKYACFMGDDDLISERIFDLAELMQDHDIDSAIVSPKTRGIYFWPGIVDARWGRVGGSLFLGESNGKVSPIDLIAAIRQCRSRVCDGPQLLPRAYSGLIAKSCIDEVISRYGALFGGCSPDIYSSRLLASVVKFHVAVDLPILLAGASKTSTSAQRSARSDIGKLKENDHLGRFQDLSWNHRIPEFYSPFTVWAQSYLQAEEKLGGTLDDESLAYLYSKCLMMARGNSKVVIKALRHSSNQTKQMLLTFRSLVILPVQYFFQKLPLLINRRPGGCSQAFSDLQSSYDATIRLDETIRRIPLRVVSMH